jgi:hypothetical protein
MVYQRRKEAQHTFGKKQACEFPVMRDADLVVGRGIDSPSAANQPTLPYEPAEVSAWKPIWL